MYTYILIKFTLVYSFVFISIALGFMRAPWVFPKSWMSLLERMSKFGNSLVNCFNELSKIVLRKLNLDDLEL